MAPWVRLSVNNNSYTMNISPRGRLRRSWAQTAATADRVVHAFHRGGCKDSSRKFQPSLKGRSARQTASTRVEELNIRYMRPFRTSLTDLYSYGTTFRRKLNSELILRFKECKSEETHICRRIGGDPMSEKIKLWRY